LAVIILTLALQFVLIIQKCGGQPGFFGCREILRVTAAGAWCWTSTYL